MCGGSPLFWFQGVVFMICVYGVGEIHRVGVFYTLVLPSLVLFSFHLFLFVQDVGEIHRVV